MKCAHLNVWFCINLKLPHEWLIWVMSLEALQKMMTERIKALTEFILSTFSQHAICASIWVHLIFLKLHPRFPHLLIFRNFWFPLTEDLWRGKNTPWEEKGNTKMCFKRNERSFTLKRQVKQCPFLMRTASDHSWNSYQSALTAIRASGEFLPKMPIYRYFFVILTQN